MNSVVVVVFFFFSFFHYQPGESTYQAYSMDVRLTRPQHQCGSSYCRSGVQIFDPQGRCFYQYKLQFIKFVFCSVWILNTRYFAFHSATVFMVKQPVKGRFENSLKDNLNEKKNKNQVCILVFVELIDPDAQMHSCM